MFLINRYHIANVFSTVEEKPMAEHVQQHHTDVGNNGHLTETLNDEDFLRFLLGSFDVRYPENSVDYTALYHTETKRRLRQIKTEAPALYHGVFEAWVRARRDLFWPDVHKAISDDPDELPLILPAVPPPLAPPLPQEAYLHPRHAEGAAPWLEAYCEHSRIFAPRAAQGFHQAIGLWLLSTISARRICVELGTRKYPMLFLALIAPSTLYTKSTAAHIARKSIRQTGCRFFLTPDRITPQALVRQMSGRVSEDYGSLDALEQELRRRDLAFAGQRGWYYEEWGMLLHQMRRHDSVMSEFHGLLRVLDDGTEDYSNETIMRGLERVTDPSLALLASATPSDLAPFMRPGTAWWRDGFWPRFAFITPMADEQPSLAPQPRGTDDLPPALVIALHTWHEHLGIPDFQVAAAVDGKGKPTGQWKGERSDFQPHVLDISNDALEAYQVYNQALLHLVVEHKVETDLTACYGRYHEKALRIALLLASVQGSDVIELSHWAYAQKVVESWRVMLHHLLIVAADSEPMSREQIWEDKIESLLNSCGALTARDIQRHLFRCTSQELQRLLASMVSIGRIVAVPKGKTTLYMLPKDAAPDDHEPVEHHRETY
jgi:Protein of unknown function (DUF3987)